MTPYFWVIPQATVSSLMFMENIIKVDSLPTACRLRTRRPQGVPSPARGRSPTCATAAGGSRRRKHTGAAGRPGLPTRARRTQTYRNWQDPRLPGAVSPVLPAPVQSLCSRRHPKKPNCRRFSTREGGRKGAGRMCTCAEWAPGPVPRVLRGRPIGLRLHFPWNFETAGSNFRSVSSSIGELGRENWIWPLETFPESPDIVD